MQSDQIDPEDLYKAAYRETQGQPVDAVGREPEDDDGFVTTSDYVDAFLGVGSESWKQTATEYAQEVYNLRTALAEKDARIVELEAQIISAWNAFGAGPKAEPPFDREDIDDLPIWAAGDLAEQIRSAEAQLTASRAECEGLRAADDLYVVWSHEHSCWWRANSQGYARRIEDAGVYTRDEALSISHRGRDGWRPEEKPDELPVRVADLPEFARAALSQKETGDVE